MILNILIIANLIATLTVIYKYTYTKPLEIAREASTMLSPYSTLKRKLKIDEMSDWRDKANISFYTAIGSAIGALLFLIKGLSPGGALWLIIPFIGCSLLAVYCGSTASYYNNYKTIKLYKYKQDGSADGSSWYSSSVAKHFHITSTEVEAFKRQYRKEMASENTIEYINYRFTYYILALTAYMYNELDQDKVEEEGKRKRWSSFGRLTAYSANNIYSDDDNEYINYIKAERIKEYITVMNRIILGVNSVPKNYPYTLTEQEVATVSFMKFIEEGNEMLNSYFSSAGKILCVDTLDELKSLARSIEESNNEASEVIEKTKLNEQATKHINNIKELAKRKEPLKMIEYPKAEEAE